MEDIKLQIMGVGQVVPEAIGRKDEIIFDIDDVGISITAYYNLPKESEIKNYTGPSGFEIRYSKFKEFLMITAKIGDLPWVDMPYTPHLSINLTRIIVPEEGQGLSLWLRLIDTSTGKIVSQRLIGLSTEFSLKLIDDIEDCMQNQFDLPSYSKKIADLYARYSIRQLAEQYKVRCKIR